MNDTTIPEDATPPSSEPRLKHFPAALFSTVMGTAGLAIAWEKTAHAFHWPIEIGLSLASIASILFIVIAILYSLKITRYPQAVNAERIHPVRMNFFPTFSIGLLLLAIAWQSVLPSLAAGLWWIGACIHLLLTLLTMNAWIHHTHLEIQHLNPAWFIPVVGNIIVPVAGVHFAPLEISWFFFSIGLVFWVVLFAVVMYRLFFHAPLALRLTPTLFILIAPPAVGFVAYTQLAGELDAFARILYYTALFLGVLLGSNAMRFFKVPFFVSAWAYSFPLAALTIATLHMGQLSHTTFFSTLGIIILILTSTVVGLLALRTYRAVRTGEICTPE